MKKLLKILVGIGVVVVLGIVAVFFLTGDLTRTADQFFAAVKNRDYPGAYQYLSEDFRASTPQSELVPFLEQSALLGFKQASWSRRSISNGRGELEGSVTTETGGVVPIKLGFVDENGRWLIYSLQKSTAGLGGAESDGRAPDQAVRTALVAEAMSNLALSIKAKDISPFYRHISHMWQQQTTPQNLATAFKPFLDREVDLAQLDGVSPTFDGAPTVDEDGLLLLKGHYPARPAAVNFEFKYVYEGVGWKLLGAHVLTQN
jgi:hypothetical protein